MDTRRWPVRACIVAAVVAGGAAVASGEPASRDKPAIYRDLVLDFYRANYFHQKGHRSEAATLAGAAE